MLSRYDISSAQFEELESPLKRIDNILGRFATEVGGRIDKNYHGRPCRDVVVAGADGIIRKIQISPHLIDVTRGWRHGNYVYGIAAMAWQDVPGGRCLSEVSVTEVRALPEDEADIIAHLTTAWRFLTAVSEKQLRFTKTM
jgi:hypothetical protein